MMARTTESITVRVEIKGTCGTCKFWGIDENPDELSTMNGEFRFVAETDDDDEPPLKRESYRPCALTVFSGSSYDHPTSQALAVDGEHYFAALYTSPTFGCPQYESKES
jgi:hypothetical protein